jgi:hypothetical protein
MQGLARASVRMNSKFLEFAYDFCVLHAAMLVDVEGATSAPRHAQSTTQSNIQSLNRKLKTTTLDRRPEAMASA